MGNIISGIMRKAVKDVEIRGHLIPKGWCVFTYFRSVHLDEKHYEEAYKFNPWRWKVSEGVCHACVAGDRSIAHLPLSFAKQGEGVSRVLVNLMPDCFYCFYISNHPFCLSLSECCLFASSSSSSSFFFLLSSSAASSSSPRGRPTGQQGHEFLWLHSFWRWAKAVPWAGSGQAGGFHLSSPLGHQLHGEEEEEELIDTMQQNGNQGGPQSSSQLHKQRVQKAPSSISDPVVNVTSVGAMV
ncbi:hypothetical protein BHE74_00025353 [Ensete ventricosum]|nr:hypothetical protein BHE74_00025353 [Ensete ventricosum]